MHAARPSRPRPPYAVAAGVRSEATTRTVCSVVVANSVLSSNSVLNRHQNPGHPVSLAAGKTLASFHFLVSAGLDAGHATLCLAAVVKLFGYVIALRHQKTATRRVTPL